MRTTADIERVPGSNSGLRKMPVINQLFLTCGVIFLFLGIYWSISGWLSHHDWGLFRILIRIVGAVSWFLLSFLFIRKAFNVPGMNPMEQKILRTVTVATFVLAAIYVLVALWIRQYKL